MALEIDPEDADAWHSKGYILEKSEKYEEAIKCYDKALEIDPNHDEAKKDKEIAEEKLKEQQISYLSLERTIYDPTNRDFVISTQRPLPNVKSWIDKNDPAMYWLVICINNDSDRPIDEWGIEVETPSALKIMEARIEGTEQNFAVKEMSSKAWLTNWILGVPHHLGIVIPRKGSKRIYFKLGSDACGVSYTINGKVSTPDDEILIKEKQFKYSCDVNTLDNAIVTDPKGARDLVSSVISSYYPGKEGVRIIDSFETIIDISNADENTKVDDFTSKLKQLRSLISEESLLNKIDEFYLWAKEELSNSPYLDSNYTNRTKRFCEEFIKDWKGEFLR